MFFRRQRPGAAPLIFRRDSCAKASLNSFVPRVPFRSDAAVLYDFWYLADVRPCACLSGVESAGVALHDSHGSPSESGNFEQFCAARFCARHGPELHGYNCFGDYYGSEVWKEPARRILLPCRWRGIPAGSGFDYSMGTMKMPNERSGVDSGRAVRLQRLRSRPDATHRERSATL